MDTPEDLMVWDPKNDPRSTRSLIELCLAQNTMSPSADDPEYWKAMQVLHHRATYDIFEAAQELCESDLASEREVGVDILAQLGVPDRTFPDECVTVLLDLLAREDNPDVLHAIGIALG